MGKKKPREDVYLRSGRTRVGTVDGFQMRAVVREQVL